MAAMFRGKNKTLKQDTGDICAVNGVKVTMNWILISGWKWFQNQLYSKINKSWPIYGIMLYILHKVKINQSMSLGLYNLYVVVDFYSVLSLFSVLQTSTIKGRKNLTHQFM